MRVGYHAVQGLDLEQPLRSDHQDTFRKVSKVATKPSESRPTSVSNAGTAAYIRETHDANAGTQTAQ